MTIAPWRNTSPLRRRRRRPVLTPVDLLSTAHTFARSATSLPGMDDPCERCWRTIAAQRGLRGMGRRLARREHDRTP